jgi:prephenate dehydratase
VYNEASLSTAAAVADMQASAVPAAAICPQRATEIYDVAILDRGIQDSSVNQTRFAVLARADHAPTGNDRTSICFSFTVDRPGDLYQCIGEFAQRNINLVKIESRPTKQALGRYIFLIDCAGHREEPAVAEALQGMRQHVDMFKVLGSYPLWEPDEG